MADNYMLKKSKIVLWSLRNISIMAGFVVMSYVSYFATNCLGISAGVIGALLLASKLFDGITDLIAGYFVEKTNTKLGKGRPYDLCIIGVWICTVLMFAVPDIGYIGKCIWLFLTYTLTNSVFFTLLSAAEPVYMMRAIPDKAQKEFTATLTGLIGVIAAAVGYMIFPVMMDSLGKTQKGWILIALVIAVPMIFIGLIRFVSIKEVVPCTVSENKEKIKIRDIMVSLKNNKYIYLLCTALILTTMVGNIATTVNTYYFNYVIGNVALSGVIGIISLVTPFVILLFPSFLKKISLSRLVSICAVIGILGCMIRQFSGENLLLILVGSALMTIGTLPLSVYSIVMVNDVIDYNEKMTGQRMEGILSSFLCFAQKIGMGFAIGGVGLIMGINGFVSSSSGDNVQQPASAINAIVSLFGVVPAALFVGVIILMHFYNIDKNIVKQSA